MQLRFLREGTREWSKEWKDLGLLECIQMKKNEMVFIPKVTLLRDMRSTRIPFEFRDEKSTTVMT